MSMLRDFDGKASAPYIHLIYGSRHETEIIFKHELNQIMHRNPNVRVTHVLSQPSRFWTGRKGRITSDGVIRTVGEQLDEKTFFICGPSTLYRPLTEALMASRVPPSQIRFESFKSTADSRPTVRVPAKVAAWDIDEYAPPMTGNAPFLCHLSENPKLRRPLNIENPDVLTMSGQSNAL